MRLYVLLLLCNRVRLIKYQIPVITSKAKFSGPYDFICVIACVYTKKYILNNGKKGEKSKGRCQNSRGHFYKRARAIVSKSAIEVSGEG